MQTNEARKVGQYQGGGGWRQYKSAANSTRIISCFTTRDTTEMMMEMIYLLPQMKECQQVHDQLEEKRNRGKEYFQEKDATSDSKEHLTVLIVQMTTRGTRTCVGR